MVWVGYAWISRLVHREYFHLLHHISLIEASLETQSHAFTHLSFALTVGLCAYNFFRAISLDPGTCPKPSSDAELKSVSARAHFCDGSGNLQITQIIEDLASEGRLNGQTFCIQCMARKPLRSKHCRVCDKCIGRHDQ